MLYRLIDPADNDELCRLSLACPMKGEITVAIDRAPDYLRFYNLFGVQGVPDPTDGQREEAERAGSWVAAVAVDDETGRGIVGVMMVATQRVLFNGRPVTIARPEDGRVHPDFQRRGIATKLAVHLMEKFPGAVFDMTIGYILRGNVKAETGIRETKDIWEGGVVAGDFALTHLSLYRPYRDPRLAVERASAADRDEIVDLLAGHYAGYNLAPVVNTQTWDGMMAASIGYACEDIRVVREAGRIVALAGLWDDGAVRRYVPYAWPFAFRAGAAGARVLARALPIPAPPRLGEPMRAVYVKHLAARPGRESLLTPLLKACVNQVRRAGRHFTLWTAFADNDPLRHAAAPLTKTQSVSRLYLLPGTSGFEATRETLRARPLFTDFSMV
ncbi:GNAT family N-acetyltransferase [bacterium]|nr:GNAT family N-acetyltransferase [bacterium]